jgi:amidase
MGRQRKSWSGPVGGDAAGGEPGSGTDRRSFLRLGALGGVAVTAGVVAGGGAGAQQTPGERKGASAASAAPGADFELLDVGVAELRRRMAGGEFTALAVTELYLERIEALDPRLSSVLEVNPDARAIASELDRERAAGRVHGALHGIPILLKDNIDTADRMTTTAGSLALEGSVPARDSTVARALREAGAVLLGKTNLSEWANFRARPSSSGWSGRGGQCRNPYVLDRSPCGSSSGSGAAAAASLCTAAIGTETDGSIVCPSSACGLVGIKPTIGLVSRAGIIPIAHSQDTAGPMARTVEDAAIVLSALTAPDARDAVTLGRPGAVPADYTVFLDAGALRGKRLGIGRKFLGFHAGVDRLMEEAIAALRDAGAEVVDPIDIEAVPELRENEQEVLLYEFKTDVEAYLRELGPGARVRTLDDLIRWNEENRERELRWFGQERFLTAAAKGPLTDPAYLAALETSRRLARAEGIDGALQRDRLDAIVAPTGGPAWTIDLVNGDHFGGGSSTHAAVAGYPNITVPAGLVQGLPVGISFFAGPYAEATLIGIAYAFEQATEARRPPTFRATVEQA